MSVDPNPAEWPQFVSHKIVRATPIVHINPPSVDALIDGQHPDLFIEPEGHHRQFFPSEPNMANKAVIGSFAMIYEDGYQSISPQKAFEEGYTPLSQAPEGKPVLMSRSNPTGWKLEDLLFQMQSDITDKTANLLGDQSLQAILLRSHNNQIVGLLAQAEALQRHSMEVLARYAPDPGPLGTPRVGVGNGP